MGAIHYIELTEKDDPKNLNAPIQGDRPTSTQANRFWIEADGDNTANIGLGPSKNISLDESTPVRKCGPILAPGRHVTHEDIGPIDLEEWYAVSPTDAQIVRVAVW